MVDREAIHSTDAPEAIGPYSQAIRVNDLVFLSGQIPLDPATMELVSGGIEQQTIRVIENLRAVAIQCDGDLQKIVKLTIYLLDLSHFATVNEVMARYFQKPYPARATVEVKALPKNAQVEIDAVLAL